jgi:hypothetical protein
LNLDETAKNSAQATRGCLAISRSDNVLIGSGAASSLKFQ